MLQPSIFARRLLVCGIVAGTWMSAALRAEEKYPLRKAATPVTRQEVWRAVAAELRSRGLTDEQLPHIEDLDLPLAVPALAGRTLRVSSACWDAGPRHTQFRLECGAPGQCLPFLAYLREPVRDATRDTVDNDPMHSVSTDYDATHDDVARDDVAASVGSCRVSSGSRPATEAASNALPGARSKPVTKPPSKLLSEPMVRAGERATTVFLADGLRVIASVTCLERGREGEVIRVRGVDGRVFRARVSGPARLEAVSRP